DRRVGKYQRELELRDRFAEHEEIDGRSRFNLREHFTEKFAVFRVGIENCQGLLPDGLVARASAVRQRYDFSFAIIELAKSRAQGWIGNAVRARAIETRYLNQLRRGHVCLRLQELMNPVLHILSEGEASVVLWKRKTEAL